MNEAKLMKYLECDQLINCVEVYEFDERIMLILDYMEGGSLDEISFSRKGQLSENFIKWSLYNVALGIQAMHNKNILHRDIKAENILCRPDGTIKLADLGFSVFLS